MICAGQMFWDRCIRTYIIGFVLASPAVTRRVAVNAFSYWEMTGAMRATEKKRSVFFFLDNLN